MDIIADTYNDHKYYSLDSTAVKEYRYLQGRTMKAETLLTVELEIGLRLRLLRKALRMNQTEVGMVMGVGQDTVSIWETGKRQPDRGALRLLADRCQYDTQVYAWLLEGGSTPSLTLPRQQWSKPSRDVVQAFKIVRAELNVCEVRDEDPLPEQVLGWFAMLEEAIQAAEGNETTVDTVRRLGVFGSEAVSELE